MILELIVDCKIMKCRNDGNMREGGSDDNLMIESMIVTEVESE